jgi:predicted ester cyclase
MTARNDTPEGVENMTGTDNEVIARRVLEEIFPANDEAALPEVISDQFVNHEAPPGTPPGLGGITMLMHLLNEAFSDQKWEIHNVVTDGDMVALRCTHSGVHTGMFFGLPATGRPFSYNQMHMVRIEDGRSVEHWAVRDDASLMQQLSS